MEKGQTYGKTVSKRCNPQVADAMPDHIPLLKWIACSHIPSDEAVFSGTTCLAKTPTQSSLKRGKWIWDAIGNVC